MLSAATALFHFALIFFHFKSRKISSISYNSLNYFVISFANIRIETFLMTDIYREGFERIPIQSAMNIDLPGR